MQPSLLEEHIIPAIPIYPLEDHSCLTFELYRDHVLKDDLVLVTFTHSRVLNASPLYNHRGVLYLHIQGGHWEGEKQGQIGISDLTLCAITLCSLQLWLKTACLMANFWFSEEVFKLLLNQKFLCFWIQKQILQTILDSKKKAQYVITPTTSKARANKAQNKK